MKKNIILILILLIAFSGSYDRLGFAEEQDQEERVIVKFKEEKLSKKALKSLGYEMKRVSSGEEVYSLKVNRGKTVKGIVEELEKRSDVDYVEPDHVRQPHGIRVQTSTSNWGVERVGANILSPQLTGRNGEIVVAVLDTGVDSTHPLLKNRIRGGYNFIEKGTYPSDHDGHGTHVAGIIVSTTGEIPVQIMPIKVLGVNGGYDSDVGQGIRYAADQGAHVINLSLGGKGYSRFLEESVEYAVAKGAVVVASAGNEGANVKDYYPAAIGACITVSAADEQDRFLSFSNFGDRIDLAAPGSNIRSSVPLKFDEDGRVDGYTLYSGTSMAAPFVSGLAALLKVENPSWHPGLVEQKLKENADDLGVKGFDPYFGHGLVNFQGYRVNQGNLNALIYQRVDLKQEKRMLISSGSHFKVEYRGPKPNVQLKSKDILIPIQVQHEKELVYIYPKEKLVNGQELVLFIEGMKYEAIVVDAGVYTLFAGVPIFVELDNVLLKPLTSNNYVFFMVNGSKVRAEAVSEKSSLRIAIPPGLSGSMDMVVENIPGTNGESISFQLPIYMVAQ